MNHKRIYCLVVFLLAGIFPVFACTADIKVSNSNVQALTDFTVYGYIDGCAPENLDPETFQLEVVKDGLVVSRHYADFMPHDGNIYAFSSGSFSAQIRAPSSAGRYYVRAVCSNKRVGDSAAFDVVSSLKSIYLKVADSFYDSNYIYIKSKIQNLFSYPVEVNYSVCAKKCASKNIVLDPYEIYYTDNESKFSRASLGIESGQFPVVVTASGNDSSFSAPYSFIASYDGYTGTDKYYSTNVVLNDYSTDYGWKKTFSFSVVNTGLKSWFNVSVSGWLVNNGFMNFTEKHFVLNSSESKILDFELELPVWAVVLDPFLKISVERNGNKAFEKNVEIKIASGSGETVNIELEMDKSRYVLNEPVSAQVTLYNIGNNTKEVYLKHFVFNRNYESAARIVIPPKSRVSRIIEFPAEKTGNYTLKVEAVNSASRSSSLKNFEVTPSLLNFSFFGIHPLLSSGTNNSLLNYTLFIKNEGNLKNTFNFSEPSIKTLDLKPGESKSIAFSVKVSPSDIAGLYEIYVSSCSVVSNECKTIALKKHVMPFGSTGAQILNKSLVLYNSMNNDTVFKVTNIYGYSEDFVVAPFSSKEIDFSSLDTGMSSGTHNITFEVFSSGNKPVFAGEMTFEVQHQDTSSIDKKETFFFSKQVQAFIAVFLFCVLAVVSYLKHLSHKSIYKYWR